MGASDKVLRGVGARHTRGTRVRTTLYDLVEAIGDEVDRGEEHLIAWTVARMVKTGQMRFVRVQKGANSIFR